MSASEKVLTWNKQKELIRFLVDGSGTVQPTSDDEANFNSDLVVLILRSCKDEHNFTKDIEKFTELRAHELSKEELPESEEEYVSAILALWPLNYLQMSARNEISPPCRKECDGQLNIKQ